MPEVEGQEDRYSNEQVSEMISKRINEVTTSLNSAHRSEIDALEQRLSKPAPVEQKTYTRTELNEAVKAKTISEPEAQAIFDNQQTQQTTDLARSTARQEFASLQSSSKTQESIDKYKEHDPDLDVKGSDSVNRVVEEVQTQCNILGIDFKNRTVEIEHTALRNIYGSAESLGGNEHGRQTHQDTHGAGDTNQESQDGMPEDLSAKEIKHYQKGIEQGRYADWKAVTKELEHANPGVRSRAKARG